MPSLGLKIFILAIELFISLSISLTCFVVSFAVTRLQAFQISASFFDLYYYLVLTKRIPDRKV